MSEAKYHWNENVQALEVDPSFIAEGLAFAESQGHHSIRIYDLNQRGGATVDLDLLPLACNATVRSLSISDSFKPGKLAIDALYDMQGLTMLAFQDKKVRPDLSRLPGLEILYAAYSRGLTGFGELRRLQHLLLTSLSEKDCSILSELVALEELRLSGGKVESLRGIEGLTKLRSVKVDYCSKLSDISAVKSLPRLTSLHVEKCKALQDFSFLAGVDSLERLFVSELDSIAFVPKMKRLGFLKFWDLRDGDVAPALQSKSLKQIDFFPNRRHYSHTKAAANAVLAAN